MKSNTSGHSYKTNVCICTQSQERQSFKHLLAISTFPKSLYKVPSFNKRSHRCKKKIKVLSRAHRYRHLAEHEFRALIADLSHVRITPNMVTRSRNMAASSKRILWFSLHGVKYYTIFIFLSFSDLSISYCACSTCCNFKQSSEFVACEGQDQRSGVEWSENYRTSGRFCFDLR